MIWFWREVRDRRRQVTRREGASSGQTIASPAWPMSGVACRQLTVFFSLIVVSYISEDLNEQGDSIDLTIFGGIRVVACRVAPVEVNIVPASLLPLPHPRLLCLGGERVTLFVQGLSNLDIADGGGIIPQQVDHGTQNCDIW